MMCLSSQAISFSSKRMPRMISITHGMKKARKLRIVSNTGYSSLISLGFFDGAEEVKSE